MIKDMNHRGFTIVELIVIITAMSIILILGVVNLASSQASARDSERKTDVETIAMHLDTYYKSGDDNSTTIGRYPSTFLVKDLITMKSMLRDIDIKSITAPNAASPTVTFIASTNAGVITQTTAAVTPQPATNQYVYQPIQSNGTLCTLESQDCRKFNIYYRTEVDNVVNMITSRNQ